MLLVIEIGEGVSLPNDTLALAALFFLSIPIHSLIPQIRNQRLIHAIVDGEAEADFPSFTAGDDPFARLSPAPLPKEELRTKMDSRFQRQRHEHEPSGRNAGLSASFLPLFFPSSFNPFLAGVLL